jgi:2,3-bisphosphoglycerate-independent phosphoglycerate mutase
MDRDKRWERVKRAYDLLVNGIGHPTHSVEEAVRNAYKKDISDEFMEPFLMHDENNLPVASINEGDAVLFFNFRTDRGRELTTALTQQAFPEQNMRPLSLHFTTLTEYDPTYKNIFVMLSQQTIENGFCQVISNQGIAQILSAETEKYPHVTFFFNGQNEVPNEKEERIMVPSPKVATYDLQPEMSAIQLADAIQPKIEEGAAGFICVNFANPDMVGHTGIIPAVVKAVETVDACVQRLTETALAAGYEVLITADHGNAEFMLNPDGTPNTAHTTNPVPLFYVSNHPKGKLHEGGLADLAPTILQLMNIEVPNEMTGKSLLA